jgi:hypothetical protein
MKTADQILRGDTTRSTLFGKFYEKIVSKWLEETNGYKLARYPNGTARKPRIYWNQISSARYDHLAIELFKPSFTDLAKKSHCTPDGLFTKNGKSYVWEAKNWPNWAGGGPEKDIWKFFTDNPWVLATKADVNGATTDISGFIFSFWDMKPEIKDRIETQINNLIGVGRFEIKLNKEILQDCLDHRYPWYVDIVQKERKNIGDFFDELLGKE